HAKSLLSGENAEQEAFEWQMARLTALEPILEVYLHETGPALARALATAAPARQRDLLLALVDLQAEAADALLPLLAQPRFAHAELALEALTWSRDPRVAPFLRDWVVRVVPMIRRAQARRRTTPARRHSVPAGFPYRAILRALRGHAAAPTEALLLLATRDWDPTYR